ncbi:MAG: aspartate aminotransferase family protein [Bacteroidota bacterium]|nr:aspartate aminotransferase family protein [Bacteroidota bacterium]
MRSNFLRHIAQTSPAPDGFEVSRGEGIYLYDQDGNAFMDCISGISVSSLGHGHPRIKQAILDQLDLHLHTQVYGEHIVAPQVALAEKLAQLLPENLGSVYFVNSGAEAVEGALKLARKYTNRYEIVAGRNAYHGSTAGAESLRSDLQHTNALKPVVPGIRHITFNEFEDLKQITHKTAAVILEAIQGEAGVVLPSDQYLSAVLKRCREVGALLILDEIQTGMGRTGSLWAFEKYNVIPDILLLAKAFGGGLPLGAFISSREIMQVLSDDPPLGHLTTFGGNALCCASGLEAIQITLDEHLHDHANDKGKKINDAISKHPLVKEIRYSGLMLAVDLFRAEMLPLAIKSCRKKGLLLDWFLFNNTSIRLYPPLIINDKEINVLIGKMLAALDEVGKTSGNSSSAL